MSEKPVRNILFMCVANSARSQLAEGLAKKLFGKAVRVESAGSQPASVNPYAIKALSEVGIDIQSHRSKAVDDLPRDFVSGLNLVVTLCAEEVCPVILTTAPRLHWPLPDPAGKPGSEEERLQRFRDTRDELVRRLTDLADELGIPRAAPIGG